MPRPRAPSWSRLGIVCGLWLISLSAVAGFGVCFFLHIVFYFLQASHLDLIARLTSTIVRRSPGRFLDRQMFWSSLERHKAHRIIIIIDGADRR